MAKHVLPAIARFELWLRGEWSASRSSERPRMPVRNPATGEIIATVANAHPTDADIAIQSAIEAYAEWKRRSAVERAGLLKRWHQEILAHEEELALLMTLEQGKPLVEAKGEVRYAASFLEWFAEEGKRLYGELVPPHPMDRRMLVMRHPVGVVATITPWNFPAAMILRKVAPALAAGCTVISKPAPQTPLTALAIAELSHRAGIPKGVFQVLPTDRAEEIGAIFTSDTRIAKISFTGSTAVGKKLMAQCASSVKRLSLELGGNAPFIVFEDADLDAAISGAVQSKFRNAGQTCICANRFLVQASIYERFCEKLCRAAQSLTVGPGDQPDVQQGPLINELAVQKVQRHISDAVACGAKILCGGNRHALGGTFFEPTVLSNVTPSMLIAREETFGPVAPVIPFSTENEAIALANDSRAGLAAYFYTKDASRFWRVAESLEYGMVGHNTGIVSTELAPFGGMKESGIGREGSRHGLLEYTELQYICTAVES